METKSPFARDWTRWGWLPRLGLVVAGSSVLAALFAAMLGVELALHSVFGWIVGTYVMSALGMAMGATALVLVTRGQRRRRIARQR
jgi:hypothetical protein